MKVASLTKAPVNAEIIEVLEAALSRARSGVSSGILLVEQVEQCSKAKYAIVGFRNRLEKLGVLAHAMHQLQEDEE